jgi:hypothetical protein
MAEFDHWADGVLVVTPIGVDGLRWACRHCHVTCFERAGKWYHFGEDVE